MKNPESLTDTCYKFIGQNPLRLIRDHEDSLPETGDVNLVYTDPELVLPQKIAERLITTLSDFNRLDDVTMGIFDRNHCKINKIHIVNAGRITKRGLKKLRGHKISFIKMLNMKVAVNDLVGCLGTSTLSELEFLNVTGAATRLPGPRSSIANSLSKLKNIHTLNVCGTELYALDALVKEMRNLRRLDISQTRVTDISPLENIKHRLVYLAMNNIGLNDQMVTTLEKLTELRHLDVSDDVHHDGFSVECPTNNLLRRSDLFPHMLSLDVSLKKTEVDIIEIFVLSHPDLKFLGAVLCDWCDLPMFTNPAHPMFNPGLQIAGTKSLSQLLLTLSRYKNRRNIVIKSLFELVDTDGINDLSLDQKTDFIRPVLEAMNNFPEDADVQVNALASLSCFFHPSMHPSLVKHIVHIILNLVYDFSVHNDIQRNALNMLVIITRYSNFDTERISTLVLNSLQFFNDDDEFEDEYIITVCLFICMNTRNFFPTQKLKSLYIKEFFSIIQRKTIANQADKTLIDTLIALWCLTECPLTCGRMIEYGGLGMFLMVLENFANVTEVEKRVLVIVNNIAGMPYLRHRLCDVVFLRKLDILLESDCSEVSYYAAGILSQLACQVVEGYLFPPAMERINAKMCAWEFPEGTRIEYFSFVPLKRLLADPPYPEARLWVLYTLFHVSSRNLSQCLMIKRDGLISLLESISMWSFPAPNRIERINIWLSKEILNFVNLSSLDSRSLSRRRTTYGRDFDLGFILRRS